MRRNQLVHYLPSGFAFNASAPQFASLFTPLLLPSVSPNPNIPVPVINDTVSVGDGIRILRAGIYQISYTLTISLDNVPTAPEAGRFFLSLGTPANIIPGSGTAVRSNVIGTGEVDVSSGVILINLNPGDLIQIVPVELIGTVDIRAAALTVSQLVSKKRYFFIEIPLFICIIKNTHSSMSVSFFIVFYCILLFPTIASFFLHKSLLLQLFLICLLLCIVLLLYVIPLLQVI